MFNPAVLNFRSRPLLRKLQFCFFPSLRSLIGYLIGLRGIWLRPLGAFLALKKSAKKVDRGQTCDRPVAGIGYGDVFPATGLLPSSVAFCVLAMKRSTDRGAIARSHDHTDFPGVGKVFGHEFARLLLINRAGGVGIELLALWR